VSASTARLGAPAWFGPVDDPENPATAILVAAAELFGETSPAQVSLRAIAARAGVNYGLIHHYFGTKEAILAELLRRASANGAARMDHSRTVDDALEQLVITETDTNYARMLAWAMLDDTDPQRLVSASPAIAHITGLVTQQLADRGDTDLDPKIVAAVIVSAVLGWRLFRPFVMVAGELTDRDEREVTELVATTLRAMVGATVDGPA